MKRILVLSSLIMVASVAAFLSVQGASAESLPSAKATAKLSNITLISWTDENSAEWTNLLSNSIKTANQKDLFIDVSLECGIYSQTLVKSKGGNKDTSTAEACIKVRVLVDGVPAEPGEVVFSRRYQELSATLEGMIFDALGIDDLDNLVLDESLVTPEEIELILETLAANSFNFVCADLSSGIHELEVQAKISIDSSAQQGNASAEAMVGKGSVTVEEVRLIKDEDILLD